MQATAEQQVQPLPLPFDIETKPVLKQLNSSNKKLAELKGLVINTRLFDLFAPAAEQ